MSNIIVQGIGFIALIFGVFSFQSNKREKILFFQLLSSIFYFLNLFLLGAHTGAVTRMFGVVRNSIFMLKGKRKWASHIIWLYIFIIIFTVSGIFTYKNVFSFLPIIAMSLGTICFWMTKPSHIRWIIAPTLILWMVYDYVSGSIAGVLLEIFYLISVSIGIIRFDILKQKEV